MRKLFLGIMITTVPAVSFAAGDNNADYQRYKLEKMCHDYGFDNAYIKHNFLAGVNERLKETQITLLKEGLIVISDGNVLFTSKCFHEYNEGREYGDFVGQTHAAGAG